MACSGSWCLKMRIGTIRRRETAGEGEIGIGRRQRSDGLLPEDAIVAVDAAGLGCCWGRGQEGKSAIQGVCFHALIVFLLPCFLAS